MQKIGKANLSFYHSKLCVVRSVTEYLVGTGGWAYFTVPNKQSLKAYSEIFNFVEVNYTFYEYPQLTL